MMPLSLPDTFEVTAQADVPRVLQCKQLYVGMPTAIIVNVLLAFILVSGQAAGISSARIFGQMKWRARKPSIAGSE